MTMDLDELWARARHGSATVAGVDFQVVVSAALLVDARSGPVEAVAIRPEGFEDIDCLTPQGGHVLVQVKDRGGGETTWTRAEMGPGDRARCTRSASTAREPLRRRDERVAG